MPTSTAKWIEERVCCIRHYCAVPTKMAKNISGAQRRNWRQVVELSRHQHASGDFIFSPRCCYSISKVNWNILVSLKPCKPCDDRRRHYSRIIQIRVGKNSGIQLSPRDVISGPTAICSMRTVTVFGNKVIVAFSVVGLIEQRHSSSVTSRNKATIRNVIRRCAMHLGIWSSSGAQPMTDSRSFPEAGQPCSRPIPSHRDECMTNGESSRKASSSSGARSKRDKCRRHGRKRSVSSDSVLGQCQEPITTDDPVLLHVEKQSRT